MPSKTDTNLTPADTSRFATTHWSVVFEAGSPESSQYREALETLFQTYWFPLYAYLRRWGCDTHRAEDCTQSFFTRLLEKKSLAKANQSRGRFRSFLLTSLKNFLSDEWDQSKAEKRGGGKNVLSLDVASAETRYTLEPLDRLSPERLFERSWALTVLKQSMERLKAECTVAEKKELFDCLKGYLAGDRNTIPIKSTAAKLNMTEGAVKTAIHRLRGRYRELVRVEIAQTVTTDAQLDEEIRYLFKVLAD